MTTWNAVAGGARILAAALAAWSVEGASCAAVIHEGTIDAADSSFSFDLTSNGINRSFEDVVQFKAGASGDFDLTYASRNVYGLELSLYDKTTRSFVDPIATDTWAIVQGNVYDLDISGLDSKAHASLTGRGAYAPAVPEPAEWAFVLFGAAALGSTYFRSRSITRCMNAR